jgi:hypothetical protein
LAVEVEDADMLLVLNILADAAVLIDCIIGTEPSIAYLARAGYSRDNAASNANRCSNSRCFPKK